MTATTRTAGRPPRTAPRYVLDPPVTPRLRDDLAELWADVVNAGGAVGFLPPVTAEEVAPELRRHLLGIADGTTRLLAGFDPADPAGRPVATAFFSFNTHRLMRHWLWLKTVMVHPEWQGRGTGRGLMAAAAAAARAMPGITGIRLTCRGGMGIERFYASCGYREIGRAPAAILAGEDDYRDEITMWLPL